MRPLVMDFPDDQRALAQKYEYMFGPAFLVAPVLDPGVTQAHVYAPESKGGWFDWWSGIPVASGSEAILDAPVGKIPLLVRAGSVVPLGPVQQYADEKKNEPLELRIYPGADGRSTLYNDDGVSYGYEQGQRSQISVSWNDKTRTATLSVQHGTYQNAPGVQRLRVRLLHDRHWIEKDVTYRGHAMAVHF